MSDPRWCVDFEASGISPDSYPVEIAVVSKDSASHALTIPTIRHHVEVQHERKRRSPFDRGFCHTTLSSRLNPKEQD
jgi:hypothetical protein